MGGRKALAWGQEPLYEGETPVLDCVRTGEIRWIDGKGFRAVVRPPECDEGTATKPRYVHIEDSGAVTLSDQPPYIKR